MILLHGGLVRIRTHIDTCFGFTSIVFKLYKVKYLNYQVYSNVVALRGESNVRTPMLLPYQRNHRCNQQKMGATNHQHPRQLQSTPIQGPREAIEGDQPKNFVRYLVQASKSRTRRTRGFQRNPSTRGVSIIQRWSGVSDRHSSSYHMGCKKRRVEHRTLPFKL